MKNCRTLLLLTTFLSATLLTNADLESFREDSQEQTGFSTRKLLCEKPKCCLDFDKDVCYCRKLKPQWQLENGECKYTCPDCCAKCNGKKGICKKFKDFWSWRDDECVFKCPDCCAKCDLNTFTCKEFKDGWEFQDGTCSSSVDFQFVTEHAPEGKGTKKPFVCPECCAECGKRHCKLTKSGWRIESGECVEAVDKEASGGNAPEKEFKCPACCSDCGKRHCKVMRPGWDIMDGRCIPAAVEKGAPVQEDIPAAGSSESIGDGGFKCPSCCEDCGKGYCNKLMDGWAVENERCVQKSGPTAGAATLNEPSAVPSAVGPPSTAPATLLCPWCCQDCANGVCNAVKQGWEIDGKKCVLSATKSLAVTTNKVPTVTQKSQASTQASFLDETGAFVCPSCCEECGNGWCKQPKAGWTIRGEQCVRTTGAAAVPEAPARNPPIPTAAPGPPTIGGLSSPASASLPKSSLPASSSLPKSSLLPRNPAVVGGPKANWVCPLCCADCGVGRCNRYKDFWVFRNNVCKFECPSCCGECDENNSKCRWFKWQWSYNNGQCKFECPHCCTGCDSNERCTGYKDGWWLQDGNCVQGGGTAGDALGALATGAINLVGNIANTALGILGG